MVFLLFNIIFCLFTLRYELEKKSSLVTRAFSAKSCTHDTDSLHSCTRLRLVQEMACLYHECKILPRKHSYPNLIPIFIIDSTPTEDAADNRLGLNSENLTSRQSLFWPLHSSASWWSYVVLGGGTVKIFVAPKSFLSVLTISLSVGSIMN